MATLSLYNQVSDLLASGALDWNSASAVIKVALVDGFAFDATHTAYSQVTGELPASGNYSTGGAILANKSLTLTTAQTKFDADNPQWLNLTSGATDNHVTAAVVYVDDFTGGAVTSYTNAAGATITKPLIGFVNFGGDQVVVAEDLTITFQPATGVFTVG